MASCYLCTSAIRPGEGHRRRLNTGQQARFYFTRRGGASYGLSYGLRTVCSSCAARMDYSNQGEFGRLSIALVVGLLSAFLAVRMTVNSSAGSLVFFFLLVGGPGWITYLLLRYFHEGTSVAGTEYMSSTLDADRHVGDSEMPSRVDQATHRDIAREQSAPYAGCGRALGVLYREFAERGISLLGCYGFDEEPQAAQRLLNHLVASVPMNGFDSIDDWQASIRADAVRVALRESGRMMEAIARHLQDGESDAALACSRLLFRLFPMRPDEEAPAYFSRIETEVEALTSEARH